jgi:hypothetical protein
MNWTPELGKIPHPGVDGAAHLQNTLLLKKRLYSWRSNGNNNKFLRTAQLSTLHALKLLRFYFKVHVMNMKMVIYPNRIFFHKGKVDISRLVQNLHTSMIAQGFSIYLFCFPQHNSVSLLPVTK